MESSDDSSGLSDESSVSRDETEGPARKRLKKYVINKYSTVALESLKAMRSRQQFCDIELEVDGHKMSAHKNILAAASPYFLAMFSGE